MKKTVFNFLYLKFIRNLFFVTLFFAFFNVHAQLNPFIDSLKILVKSEKNDTIKVDLLNDIAWEMGFYEPYEAVKFGRQALTISFAIQYQMGTATAMNYIGLGYYHNASYDTALFYFEQAAQIRQKLNDEKGYASVMNNISLIYEIRGNYDEALKIQNENFKTYKKYNDIAGLARCSNNIGNIFFAFEQYDKARQFYTEALSLKKILDEPYGMATALSNIGIVYFEMAKKSKGRYKNNLLDSALLYHTKALNIRKQLQDKSGISICFVNMGNAFSERKNYSPALHYYLRALKIHQELQNLNETAITLFNIGKTFQNQNQANKALEYFNKSLTIASQIQYPELRKDCFMALSEIHLRKGDYQLANVYFMRYNFLRDSIFNLEQQRQLLEIQAKYDLQNKEFALLKQKATINELEIKKSRIISIGLSTFIFILITCSIYLYFLFKQRKYTLALLQKSNLEVALQNNILQKQKEELQQNTEAMKMYYETLEEQSQHVTSSINYARQIQETILIAEPNLKKLLPKSFVINIPKDIVSGDFLWLENRENNIFVAAVDCTGHGVPAALMSIMAYNILNQALHERKITDPSKLLNFLNSEIYYATHKIEEHHAVKTGMDMALIKLNLKKNFLEFAGALRPIYIVREKRIIEFRPDYYPIGIGFDEDFKSFSSNQIAIFPDDLIYLFTDGFTDQFGGPNNKKLSTAAFKELLIKISSLTLFEQKQQLMKYFNSWKGNRKQIDDVLIAAIKIGGKRR